MTTKHLTLRLATALLLAVPATATLTATPAHAFFGGFGRIVYDPQNHAENIVSAARALEQINNQITSLQSMRRLRPIDFRVVFSRSVVGTQVYELAGESRTRSL
jgi:hypothetical protein